MKSIATAVLAAALLLLLPAPASGQATVALTGGMNFAFLAIDNEGRDASPRSARRRSLGLAAAIPLAGRVDLHLGGTYSQKGASQVSRRDRFSGELQLDYVELMALGRVQAHDSGEGVELYFLAGPTVAMETSCQWYGKVTREGQTEEHHANCLAESTASWDFGVAGGVWADMWISDTFGMMLSGLYTVGLPDIDTWSDVHTMRTRTLNFSTGVIWSIG